jgi:hypothetical protein
MNEAVVSENGLCNSNTLIRLRHSPTVFFGSSPPIYKAEIVPA